MWCDFQSELWVGERNGLLLRVAEHLGRDPVVARTAGARRFLGLDAEWVADGVCGEDKTEEC